MQLIPSSPAKYQQIFDALRRDINGGKYQPGQKIPSEADLIKRFGASRITVGRAVRELQQRNLVERRAGSGTYVSAGSAEGLAFGLIIPDLGETEIFEPICQGMASSWHAANHVLLWGNSVSGESRREQAWRLCQQFITRRVSGVFFAPLERLGPEDRTNEKIVDALDRARIPVVLLDRDYLPYPERSPHDLVGVDNRRAAYAITHHLIRHGARRIVFLSYPGAAATVGERVAGYREALFAYRQDADPALVQTLDPEDGQAVRAMIEGVRPDAIVCANDRTAGLLMCSLLALRMNVPRDVRVAGIDDVGYARMLPVALTTMHQPCREIGLAAMTVMAERLAHPESPARDVSLECRLVVRDSCGGKEPGSE